VADAQAAALDFDEREEEASLPRGTTAAAASRKPSRPTRMTEQASPV
jgi:hypothetical protein